ncbi:MAG TPA: hypothetical protein VGR62_02065 [Candidatus Binatia bacterium]|jgi:hypothetical protein|nr:hypothetical protein [Candidatus Binatia bacterium]
MKFGILLLGGALIVASATLASAEGVNCKQVKKYLDTGRSVKDVAETMVVSEADVKNCQEQLGGDAPKGDAPAADAAGHEGH